MSAISCRPVPGIAEFMKFLEIDETSKTGLRWIATPDPKIRVGDEALRSISKKGYFRGWFGGRQYMAHRVVFLLKYGHWPEKQIDHIDGNPKNNRIENLREVSGQTNIQNRKSRGTTFNAHHGKWHARICANGVSHHLGYFKTETEAHSAYLKNKKLFHPEAGDHCFMENSL